MNITFENQNRIFSYRACAIIIHDYKILAMHDERNPFFYLPGGRVKFHETAEQAVLRELKEELDIEASIVRPLWLDEAFFTNDLDHKTRHELGLYFLIDVAKTDLLYRGSTFRRSETRHQYVFEWIDFSRVQNEYFYPLFIKNRLSNLPKALTIINENEL